MAEELFFEKESEFLILTFSIDQEKNPFKYFKIFFVSRKFHKNPLLPRGTYLLRLIQGFSFSINEVAFSKAE